MKWIDQVSPGEGYLLRGISQVDLHVEDRSQQISSFKVETVEM